MGAEYLNEYLVRLGFDPDRVGYARFAGMLREASSLVDNEYLRMAKAVVGFQFAGIDAFTAVGAATLGFADRAAMADQSYRLLALRLYTSLPVARELKVALDALGEPLENVVWDPELSARFHQLIADQQALTSGLGSSFEANMKKIRDLRFEFTRMGVTIENYLIPALVNDLAQAFGVNIDQMEAKLRQWNNYLIIHMPDIARSISDNLTPVLHDVKDILGDTWGLTKELATDFIHFIGLLGDDSLTNAPLTFGNLAKAIGEVAHGAAVAIEGLLKLETNIGLLFDAGIQASGGNWGAALKDLKSMQPIGVPTPPLQGTPLEGAGRGMATPANIQQAIIATARALGVPPELALAVAAKESAGGDVSAIRQFDRSGKILTSPKGAEGIFQLMPGTAKMLGVNPEDVGENILGGLTYLRDLLKRHSGGQAAALREYNSGWPMSRDPGVRQYASDVQRIESGITIQNLTVNVPPDSVHSLEAIADAVTKGIQRGMYQSTKNQQSADQLKVQRTIKELTHPGWVPGQ